MNIGFSYTEIKELTTAQVNLYFQRNNEPVYKQRIEQKLNEVKN